MGCEVIGQVLERVGTLAHNVSKKSELFRKRSGKDIIDSGFSTGCSDGAIVARYLLKNKGYACRFVDVLKASSNGLKGHVFLKCGDIYVDPAGGRIMPSAAFLKKWDWVSECDELVSLTELKRVNASL